MSIVYQACIVGVLLGIILGLFCKGWNENKVLSGIYIALGGGGGSLIFTWLTSDPMEKRHVIGVYLICLLATFLIVYWKFGRSKPGAVLIDF